MSIFTASLVEFFGLPRAGKTTAVEALAHRLARDGYNVAVVRERASVCPIRNKMGPLFNYWTAISQLKEYVEACDRGVDLLIADRGILDAAVWLNYKNESGEFDEEVADFTRLLDNRFMNKRTLLGLWFTADIEVVLRREFERRITPTPGTVMNRRVLAGYADAYSRMKGDLEARVPITEIDTTNLDISSTIKAVYGTVATALQSEPRQL